jgi:hypothetical protein
MSGDLSLAALLRLSPGFTLAGAEALRELAATAPDVVLDPAALALPACGSCAGAREAGPTGDSQPMIATSYRYIARRAGVRSGHSIACSFVPFVCLCRKTNFGLRVEASDVGQRHRCR